MSPLLGVVIPTSPAPSVWVLLDGVAHSSVRTSALWRGLRGGETVPERPAWSLTQSPGIWSLLSSADPLLCQGTGLGAMEDGHVPLSWC